jgi:hypothetical protein
MRLSANELSGDHTIGFVQYFADKLKGRFSEINSFNKLVIRARTLEPQPVKAKITLINKDGFAFSSSVTLTNSFQDIEIPLTDLKPDSMMLLPRPYPEFMPLWFKAKGESSFDLSEIEKVQVTIGTDVKESEFKRPFNLEVQSIWLPKKK